MISVLASETVAPENVSHVLELFVILSTIALTIVTVALTWISYKLYKVDSEKVSSIANNSIDSMEHVAITAITHEDRVRQLKRIRSHRH
jgi:hypothetical protein